MSGSKYEFVYTSALTASGAIFLVHLGSISGFFDIGLAYRGWLYASLAFNIIAILCLLSRKVIDKYEEDRIDKFKKMPPRDKIIRHFESTDFAKQHPVKNYFRSIGSRIRSRSSRPIGWIGIGLVVFSVIFYLSR